MIANSAECVRSTVPYSTGLYPQHSPDVTNAGTKNDVRSSQGEGKPAKALVLLQHVKPERKLLYMQQVITRLQGTSLHRNLPLKTTPSSLEERRKSMTCEVRKER